MSTNAPADFPPPPPQKLRSASGRMIAYRYQKGSPDLPAVIYLHGYASDMMATKAQFLAQACAARNQSYLRFDYSGNGVSNGDFQAGTLGDWIEDALAVIDGVTEEKLVLVGSSMGGWIGLHCALQRPKRIAAFIGIAAAPDFTEDIWVNRLTESQRQACIDSGYYDLPGSLDHPLRLYNGFLQEGRKHLLLDMPIRLDMPVTLLQGRLDVEVPWETAYKIQALVTPAQAEVVIVEDGDHRLARQQDMEKLDQIVLRLSRDAAL